MPYASCDVERLESERLLKEWGVSGQLRQGDEARLLLNNLLLLLSITNMKILCL